MKYNFMFLLRSGRKYYCTGTVFEARNMKANILKHCQELPFTFVWSHKDSQYLACSLSVPFVMPEV